MNDASVSAGGLHALVYCERLFYLEEVERIRLADARVFAGRRLHTEIEPAGDEGEFARVSLESESLGIHGTMDLLKRRDGQLIPHEHKRGRSAGRRGAREAWETDRVQVGAYAMLVEEAFRTEVSEGRIRYHADRITVRVPIDPALRAEVRRLVARATEIRSSIQRPPVTTHQARCRACSLAPVCLPEEARLAADPTFRPVRLLPKHPEGQTLHILDSGARAGRSGDELVIEDRDGAVQRVPIVEVGSVVVHGLAQITTQAIRLCADHDI